MKEIKVPLDKDLSEIFFKKAIRNKRHIIELLMTTIKYVKSNLKVDFTSNNYIHIIIDDMNRFVYQSDDKIFSIRSPFNIEESNGDIRFYNKFVDDIDNVWSSKIIALVKEENFETPNSLDFLSIIEEHFEDPDIAWAFILDLLSYEDGYLRFDNDPDNENGRLHPITHLDICYTTAATFKIGTYTPPCIDYFSGLLNNKLESKYLER